MIAVLYCWNDGALAVTDGTSFPRSIDQLGAPILPIHDTSQRGGDGGQPDLHDERGGGQGHRAPYRPPPAGEAAPPAPPLPAPVHTTQGDSSQLQLTLVSSS